MKILLGWELGAGQGHIQRLVALAQQLEAVGHEPVFALKSYQLNGQPFPWQRCAVPQLPYSGRENSFSFADILATFGFDNAQLLQAHIDAWQTLIKEVQPALVITDHAPGLVLAAQDIAPTIVIGSHFTVPPNVETFPLIRCPAPEEATERQEQVSEAVHRVSRVDAPLGTILNGDRSFIFSLPELDWYRFWRTNPKYVGIQNLPIALRAKETIEPWAYLASDYDLKDRVLKTLNPESEFKPIHQALENKGLAIHHGGLTTTIACLLAGIPQLVLPRYVEQQLTTFALLRLGVAEMGISPSWEDLLIQQAKTFAKREKAYGVAIDLAAWNQNLLDVVVQGCLEFLV
jgi:UDP:flavonoid glycosyltransferase YjiC (YdhE family)